MTNSEMMTSNDRNSETGGDQSSETGEPRRTKIPPASDKGGPQADLEEKLRSNPNDPSTKLDVGSDESMDASDPPSVVQPAHDEPVPSSGSPDERSEGREG